MEFKTETSGNTTILKTSGRMDIVNAPEFEKAVQDLLGQGITRIVADLAQVDYISSAGLRAILVAAKKAKAGRADLVFSCVSGMVLEVFTISGFKSMFRLFDTTEEALAQGEPNP